MRFLVRYLLCTVWLFSHLSFSQSLLAQSTEIYKDDFEQGVSGWSVNKTYYSNELTHILGNLGKEEKTTSRQFSVPKATGKVVIEFDFYRFDSWDDGTRYGRDRFQIDIDGAQVFSLPFNNVEPIRVGRNGNVEWLVRPLTDRKHLGFNGSNNSLDQIYRVELIVNNPSSTLDLTLRLKLNQSMKDESAGFDNIAVTAYRGVPISTPLKNLKTAAIGYSLRGEAAEYTLSVQNAVVSNQNEGFVFVDDLPKGVSLYTGDLDGAGSPVIFGDNSLVPSGLKCCVPGDVEFSNSKTMPPVFGYVPSSDYDDSVTHIRITPSGSIADSQTASVDLNFTFLALAD